MINIKNNIKNSLKIRENLFLANLPLAGRRSAKKNQKTSMFLISLRACKNYHSSKTNYPLRLANRLPTPPTSHFYRAFGINIGQNSNLELRSKTFKKIQALSDLSKTFENLASSNSKKTKRSIKKSVATLYYLLIAYKKTLRVKLNYYFNNSTNLQFFLALSPFIIYFIQMSVEKYDLKYQQNTFLQKSLPGLKRPIQNMTWETFAYTQYSNKLDSNFITQINSVDDGFFISLNPSWQFKQKQLLTGTFESSLSSTKKWSFLPSRYFYQLLSETQKRELNSNNLSSKTQKPDLKSRQIEVNSRWQLFFNELDDIPTKLNSVFQTETNLFRSSNRSMDFKPLFFSNSKLCLDGKAAELGSAEGSSQFKFQNSLINQKLENQTFIDNLDQNKKIVSLNDFKELFPILTSNYQEFTQTKRFLKIKQTSETQKNSNFFSHSEVHLNLQGTQQAPDKTLFLNSQQIRFTPINLALTEIKENPLNHLNKITKLSGIGVINPSMLSNENSKQLFSQAIINTDLKIIEKNPNLKSQNQLSQKNRFSENPEGCHPGEELWKSSAFKPIRFNGDPLKSKVSKTSDQTWIRLLTETWTPRIQNLVNESESPKKVSFERTFHYNVDSGFSKIGNLIKVNVLAQKPKNLGENQRQVPGFNNPPLFKVWQKTIRQDLSSPIPAWAREFKAQSKQLLKTAEVKLPSFLQLSNPHLFIKSEFEPLFKEALVQNPESLLKLFQKPDVNKNSLFIQRKLSGYLYPDSFRESILMDNGHNFGERNTIIRETDSLLEGYNRKFSTIGSQSLLTRQSNLFRFLPKLSGGDTNDWFKKNKESGSLLQVYQPLTSNLMDLRGEKNGISNASGSRVLNILNTSSFQKNNDFLTRIEPDQSFSTKKDYFFGIPIESPIYGLTGKDYKEKYETRKRDIPKDRLVNPYTDSFNFLIRSNSKLLKANFFGEEEAGFLFSNSSEFPKKALLNEMTKAATFSNVVSEKPFFQIKTLHEMQSGGERNRFSETPPLLLQKTEKSFGFDAPVPYKTQLHYTKARVFSNTVNSLEKSLKKSSFSTNLYEPINFKTWAILSQFGFVFIVLKLSEILQKEYNEEVLYYIAEFYAFLNDYDKNSLQIFSQGENIRVIKKINKKFSDLVGGRFLLTEFGEAILLLRNSRKVFSKMKISKPQLICLSPVFTEVKRNTNEKTTVSQRPEVGLNQNLRIKKSTNFKTFHNFQNFLSKTLKQHDLFAEKPSLRFENFIPKGILLVGPPGTGKTLLVQAFAGEAAVPVIVESGKMLTTNMETNGAERLKDLFKAAREMSPCILFLDEVDTLGQKREKVLSASMVGETENLIPNPLNGIYSQKRGGKDPAFFKLSVSENFIDLSWDILNPVVRQGPQISKSSNTPSQPQNDLKIQITNQKMLTGEKQNQDLHLLTQLLYELDGLNKRQDIVVIGATNRPATLDSALTRPGRFGKIIYLDLPGKEKRFELLKFYSQSRNTRFTDSGPERFVVSSPGAPQKKAAALHFMQSFWLEKNKVEKFFFQKNESAAQMRPKKFFEPRVPTTFKPLENPPTLQLVGTETPFESRVLVSNYHFGLKSLTKNQFQLSNFNILKKRPKSLGVDANIDWNYFANQTVGLSSAHLSAAMNRSALKAMWIYFSKNQNEKSIARFFSSTLALAIKKGSQNKDLTQKNLPNSLKTDENLKRNSSKSFELDNFYQEVSPQMFHQFIRKNPKIELSKELKLRLIVQSGLGNTEILDQLFSKDFDSQLDLSGKTYSEPAQTLSLKSSQKNKLQTKEPFHTFETIEYGIQTISTMNTSLQIRTVKGKQVNKKIIGQPPLTDFFNNQTKIEFLANSQKNQLKRDRFYKKHRPYLRTLALLGIENQVNSYLTGFRFGSKLLPKLKMLNKYVNRILQNQSFGWLILSNSTCLIQNPFFSFSIQKQKTKNLSEIYYHLLSLNDSALSKNPLTFLKSQSFNFSKQNSLFGDSLFINRSAYYLSGKSLINFSNQNQSLGQRDQPISLWSFIGSSQARHPKLSFQNGFLTKIQFESSLLSLIAGKATEKLMLTNQLFQKQESNIGLDELKELRGLIRLMSEDYFVTSPKQLTRKQININLVENKKEIIQEEELLFLKELATGFENQNRTGALSIPRSRSLRFSDQFASVEQPWWQLKSFHLVASSNLKYGEWYRLFVSEEQQTFRNIEWVAPDTYFHNQVNNAHLASNVNVDSNDFIKNNMFINSKLILKYIEFSKLNWNQLQLLDSESMLSYFIFESFNKVFILLENNREFLDLVSYSLICYENLRQFEILDFYQRFFKENK